MKRKIIPLLLILVMLSSIFGAGYAQDFITSNSSGFEGGSGTGLDPYQIATAEQLNNVRNYLGPGNADKHFELVADIDLTAYGELHDGGKGWMPIGSSIDANTQFTGHFDGGGYAIKNLYIDRAFYTWPYLNSGGLFGETLGATIKNIKLQDVNITGYDYVGGLVGKSFNTTITNSYITGTVKGNDYVGGLGGLSDTNITSSYFTGVVEGKSWVGGLVGSFLADLGRTITNSYAEAGINGINYVGGLVGQNLNGTVENSYTTGAVTGTNTSVGGLVGENINGIVKNSYATGAVKGPENSVGGLVGLNFGTVTASYYDKQTTGQTDTGKGIPKTTAEMKQEATFSGWNFTNTWAIIEGVTYPYLQWQQMAEPGGFAGGSGTEADPYKIATAGQLNNVRNNPNGHFILVNDIDMGPYLSEGGAGYNEGKGWEPIGGGGDLFQVSFDGDGHTISNLFINRTNENNIGLFGIVFGKEITGVNLTGLSVTGNDYVGGLVAGIYGGTISDSHVTGSVSGNNFVGGLVGGTSQDIYTYAKNTIQQSTASVNVTGNQDVGGLVGSFTGSSMSKSRAMGDVSGSNYHVGGLVGFSGNSAITESYATGSVSTTGASSNYYGGLVGYISGGSITDSYATGSVNGYYRVGGLVGGLASNITNSYSTGQVTGLGPDLGGLVGWNDGTVTASYYDSDTSGRTDTGKGEPKPTAEMKQQATFEGWDFVDIWAIQSGLNNGYPFLRWQHDIEPTYTVTYDANTGENPPVDGSSYNVGDEVTVLGIGDMSKEGHTFFAWNTEADGTGDSYDPDDIFEMSAADVILYAQWEVIGYTVTFDLAEYGTRTGGGELEQTVNHGDDAEAPIIDVEEGWHFTDWDTGFTNVTSDLTVTAQYSRATYTVTFDLAEYGTRTGGGELEQTVNHGDDAEAPIIDVEEGWHFTDWDTGFTNVTSDLTVTAQYSRATYTVTFDSHGGSAVDSQTVAYGQTADEPEEPTKEGYTFGGWYTEEACINEWDFFEDTVTGDLTLYARWSALPLDCTPETAWAAGDRYVSGRGPNWATYTSYSGNTSVTLYAGQHMDAGTVHFSASESGKVTITITLNDGWRFEDAVENIKIQDYSRRPRGNPRPDRFDHKFTASGSQHSVEIPQNSYYGVNVNVCKPVTAYSTFEQQADLLAEAKNDRLEDAENDELVGDGDVAKGDLTIKTEDAKADDDLDHDSGLDNGTIANSSDCCDDNETDDKNAVTSVKDNDDVDGNDENGADLPENNSKTQTLDEVTYTLDLVIVGKGTVVSEEELEVLNEYEADSEVELTAVPAEGWDFEKWVIDEVEEFDATINIIIKEDLEVTAVFVLKPEPESEPEPDPDLEVVPDLEAVNEEKEDNHRPDNPGSQGKGRK